MESTQSYLDLMVKSGLFSSVDNLKFYLNELFGHVDFKNKNVLDIGGGSGLLTFYAAVSGAVRVICLEPEFDGSSSGMNEKFNALKKTLLAENASLVKKTFQDFTSNDKFDVVMMHHSINHLNEEACESLQNSEQSRKVYAELFKKLYNLCNPQAEIIICDCSRYNFFQLLGVKNPFMPTIEWDKHQDPALWAELMIKVGFRNPKIEWSAFSALGRTGSLLFANKLAAYFFRSHFCLKIQKV